MRHPSLVMFSLILFLCSSVSASSADKPRVLILGDSISIGYTSYVQKMMENEAVVMRPTGTPNPKTKKARAENCAGTTKGINHIDRWLEIDGGNWDVIHFNFGLHDLKRVKPGGKNSNDPNDSRQAELDVYEKQFQEITDKLKATGATLIFATTTPYPAGVQPHRDPQDAERYNDVAKKIVIAHGGSINDLYAFALPKLKEIQQPMNVHFSAKGSQAFAEQVVKHLKAAIKSSQK